MRINIFRHPDIAPTCHVNCITLMVCTDDCVVIDIDLHTKRECVSPQAGASDETYDASVWVGGDEIMLTLPESFEGRSIAFSETTRYTARVCFMRRSMYDHPEFDEKELIWKDT